MVTGTSHPKQRGIEEELALLHGPGVPLYHLVLPRDPPQSSDNSSTMAPALPPEVSWDFHQNPLECHFNFTCLEEPGDSPSARVLRRLAESPGLAKVTYATQVSSPNLSNLPVLTVCHSGFLLSAFPMGAQYRFTGV